MSNLITINFERFRVSIKLFCIRILKKIVIAIINSRSKIKCAFFVDLNLILSEKVKVNWGFEIFCLKFRFKFLLMDEFKNNERVWRHFYFLIVLFCALSKITTKQFYSTFQKNDFTWKMFIFSWSCQELFSYFRFPFPSVLGLVACLPASPPQHL